MQDQGVLTFLFTDIEGSTRRWQEDPAMADALARHDAVVEGVVAEHGGRLVKHTGDGVFAAFTDAGGAVRAAVAIQRGLVGAFDENPIRVRIGLHSGEAHARDGDIFGLAVSTAARIMGAGHGGQVLASEATKALSGSVDGVDFVDLGFHRLKDLGEARVLFQVQADGLEGAFPPLLTLEGVEHNFPLQLTSFVGRAEQVADVIALVESHRLVTVTGVGGAGKTRLTMQVAAELVAAFRHGARFVELAPVTDPDAVPAAVAAALGVRHERGQSGALADRLIEHLTSREMLLVIDNCEHVLGVVARLVTDILSTAPDIRVLASSREGLGVRGERIWQLPSLEVSADREAEAVRLFLDRAQAVAPQLQWNEDTRDHIVRICQLVDGIPLAIELAAARARVLSPEQIASRLSDRFRLLTGGSRSALPRQQTLEATVDWSYQLLGPDEQRLFTRLSVFGGGFELEAVEAVCTDADVVLADVLDLLTGLVDRSMVLVERDESGVVRYRMLETLRQFGLQRLSEVDDIGPWKQRHLEYFAELVSEMDLLGWDGNDHVETLEKERANLTAGLEWARSTSSDAIPQTAVALALDHQLNLGVPEAALDMIEVAARHQPPEAGESLRIQTMRMRILHDLGRMDTFLEAWSALQPRLDSAADSDAVWCLCRVASIYAWDPELDADLAVGLAREALGRAEHIGDRGRFLALLAMARALMWSGAPVDETTATLRKTLEIGRRLEDPDRVMFALSTLLLVVMTADERDGTEMTAAVEDEMFELWERTGRADSDEFILWAGLRRGWWNLVEREIARLEPQIRGVRRAWVLMPLGVLRMMQGRPDEADSVFDEVAGLGPIRRWHHDYYPCRAEVAAMRGDLEAVNDWVAQHSRVPMDKAEQVLRLAGIRALVRTRVDVGDVDGAVEARNTMRSLSREAAMPAVQLGSPKFYLACAEAELTRATGPDPQAWERAGSLSTWAYWSLYCRVRELEAHLSVGSDTAGDLDALRDEARSMGAQGLLDLIDSFVR